MSQDAVQVNEGGVICKYRKDESEGAISDLVEVWGTAIHAAVYFRDVDAANILLNCHRVDTNKANDHGETALMWCGASNSLKDLVYKFDSVGNIIILPDEPSPSTGTKDVVEDREEAEEPHVGGPEDIARVQLACALLREQADRYATDIHGRTALHWAKYGDYIAAPPNAGVAAPVGTDVSLQDLPFVSEKCRSPRLAAVLYYDPARYKIYHLARDGCIAGVRALLDQGVSINESCPEGWYTPLIAAVYNKDVTMARFLLQFSSIEINFKGKHQTTALHYAAQEGCLAICGLLLFHKADRSALTSTGLLPIDFALSKGHKEIAACLRFDPQKVSICLAAKHGDLNVFTALINQVMHNLMSTTWTFINFISSTLCVSFVCLCDYREYLSTLNSDMFRRKALIMSSQRLSYLQWPLVSWSLLDNSSRIKRPF
jgi:ankyrin repeat protein